MAFEKEHFGAGPTHGEVAHPHPRQMPSVLTAPDIILRWCTRVMRLEQGRIVDDGPAQEVLERYLGHPVALTEPA